MIQYLQEVIGGEGDGVRDLLVPFDPLIERASDVNQDILVPDGGNAFLAR
ncbi:MAG: hypothetical protein FD153_1135 [Rhodospirillaceae bacterium]|nr:MAG: hypothetical protein FD153_1135 [Rhodospirillaceae bacterium]